MNGLASSQHADPQAMVHRFALAAGCLLRPCVPLTCMHPQRLSATLPRLCRASTVSLLRQSVMPLTPPHPPHPVATLQGPLTFTSASSWRAACVPSR
jgi:hypothetical protein